MLRVKAVYGESRTYGLVGNESYSKPSRCWRVSMEEEEVLRKILDPPFSHYEVFSDGRVRNIKTGKFRKTHVQNSGYEMIELWEDAYIKKHYLMHQLVAQCFIPNPHSCKYVNHIDNNRLNNDYRNLEWVTTRSNLYHAQKQGRLKDREMHPYELLDNELGTSFIFPDLKSVFRYIGDRTLTKYNRFAWARTGYPALYKSGVTTRISDRYGVRLALELDINDYDWTCFA